MSDETTAPIAHERALRCTAAQAFSVYTCRIGEWWDPRYTANPDTLGAVTIEPHVGGRIYAEHSDLGRHDWGEVTVWEPGRRLVHTFTLAQNPGSPSEVVAEFEPSQGDAAAPGSTLRFVHGGWTAATVEARKKFGDWPVMLDRFVALADSEA